jgi:hypothetical protein
MTAAGDLPSSGRALVALDPPARDPHARRPVARVAGFVTQLIATAQQFPQTRARRRADPQDVIAAYQATVARIRALDRQ